MNTNNRLSEDAVDQPCQQQLLKVTDTDEKANEALDKANRWQERADEFALESSRLRAQAQALLEKANRQDEQKTQCERKAEEAIAQNKKLKFKSLLSRLKLNDQDIVEIDNRNNDWPQCHGKALAEALLHNTMVTKIDLEMLEFKSAQSESKTKEGIQRLFQYLSDNASLLHVGLHGKCFVAMKSLQRDTSMLLGALSTCSNLETLKCTFPVPPWAILRLLSTPPASSLRELDIMLENDRIYAPSYQQRVISAFRSNTTLQRLKLRVSRDGSGLTIGIVNALRENASTTALNDLSLEATSANYDELVEALFQYLSSTCTLQRFELVHFSFISAQLERLLQGLKQVGTSQDDTAMPPKHTTGTTHVSSLSFSRCNFIGSSLDHLVTFLKTATTDGTGETMIHDSHLRRLHVSSWRHNGGLSDEESLSLADALLMELSESEPNSATVTNSATLPTRGRPPVMIPTIGSQLDTLSVVSLEPAFLHHLRDHAGRVQLQSLELSRVSEPTCVALETCLPCLTLLRRLQVSKVEKGGTVPIARGIQKNSSIVKVDVVDDSNACKFDTNSGFEPFGASQCRMMDAYCQRNQHLNAMLASELPRTLDNNHDDDNRSSQSVSDASDTTTAGLNLRPALLVAATPSTRCTTWLQGVLNLDQHIG